MLAPVSRRGNIALLTPTSLDSAANKGTPVLFRLKSLASALILGAFVVAAGAFAQRRAEQPNAPLPNAPITEARGAGRPLVVIDAGHGGKDAGAISPTTGIREKDVNLAVARAIRDALARSGRVRVAMTRDDDSFVPLPGRVAIARGLHAGLFVAVHSDSAPNPLARGATIYTLSEVASDREAERLAAAENRRAGVADVDLGTSDPSVRAILADLTQRETMAVSADFAGLLQREAAGRGVGFRQQYHRFANFVVLKAADTAAVLLETGYLTNDADMRFLTSPEGRARIGTGMARAIETHFARWKAAPGRNGPL